MTMDLFAAGTVVALPFVVIALSRWAARGIAGRSVPAAQWLIPCVAFLSGAAGVIHLLVIEEHLAESRLHAGLFAALAAFQLLWAVIYPLRPRAWLGWLAIAVNLGTIGVWVVSRTTGLPGWLDGGEVEAVGLADLASTLLEAGLVLGLLALLWSPLRDRARVARPLTRGDAALGTAMVVVVASLLTLGAIAEVAAGTHTHADGADHEAEIHADG